MAIVQSSGYAHVRLTVTDIKRSKAFYDEVFGWPVVADASARVDEPGITESQADLFGGTIYLAPGGVLLGLRPVALAGQRFDPNHTGLDHISFQVSSREDLVAAAEHFQARGIEHGEITELPGAGFAVLSFSDPDGVQCELTAAL